MKRFCKRLRRSMTAAAAAMCAIGMTAGVAMADMNGYDISNWQCGIDVASTQADFVIVGTTWGTGGINNVCLANGVNTDADRMIAAAYNSGKKVGVYHYARGGNPEAEARFFVNQNRARVGKAMLILDWESQDNAAWGNTQWPRRWATEVKRLTGVNPVIYTMDSAYWQVSGMPQSHNTGLWIAQYASNAPTGYQSVPWRLGTRGEAMRQYTSNGVVGGYAGRLDLDLFRGDRAAWDAYANPAGKARPQATTMTTDLNALASAVIRGEYGNGRERRARLGGNYDRVMAIVNARLGSGSYSGPTTVTTTRTYVVRSGDTVSAIAERTGLKPASAWRVPSGNINRIYVGQTITYYGTTATSSASGYYGSATHVVRSGESLWSIYGAPGWASAAARNGIRYPYTIYPGQRLR